MNDTERERRLVEIRERVAKATPGPWRRDRWDDPEVQVVAAGNEVVTWHRAHVRQNDTRVVPNHELIAHAPEDLSWLLDQLKERDEHRRILIESLQFERGRHKEKGDR